jgi:phytanoyl-CoA hydroxylase
MIGFLKRIKMLYSVYNFFHRKQLVHHEALFKKYGIRKKYFSSLSSRDFKNLPAENGQLKFDIEKLKSARLFNSLDESSQQSLLSFEETGFAILKGYLSDETTEKVNTEIESLLTAKRIKFIHRNKLMFAIGKSRLLRDIGNDPGLREILSVCLGGNSVLFQSINFLTGSEQATHSDSIHMTTYPLGGLIGVWFALEEIGEDNGPLHYYPGSHKLPYYLNKDYGNEGNAWLLGEKPYTEYEEMMRQKIRELNLTKRTFLPKKGDVLIWHANLFHGGEPHLNKAKTRKSMVFHYFKEGSICYHEISQRPALLKDYSDPGNNQAGV